MTHTDWDIEQAARVARNLARENFAAGKPYENPYSEHDVMHHTYRAEWAWAEREAWLKSSEYLRSPKQGW